MPSARRAVIDVGTNSIKLLVAEVAGREIRPIWEESRQTRLGQSFYATRRLQPEPIVKSAKAVAEFAEKARAEKAVSIRIIATSAARDAANVQELISAIEGASQLRMEIISGEQEADMVFQGVTTDPALSRESLLLLDVGGGSTEFILGHGDRKDFRQSFPLGTVRLMETFKPGDPPKAAELPACREWVRRFLNADVQPKLAPALRREEEFHSHKGKLLLVGTGGTASILGCMEAELTEFNRQTLEETRLSAARLRSQVERLWGLSLAERMQVIGLPPNRADVILTGAAIYEGVMEVFGFETLRISTRGLRFAAVMEQPDPT
jgi:exopolyphosphatase/guanosine-5'-triphosphate,3'-diphosphate pyrophosphatase